MSLGTVRAQIAQLPKSPDEAVLRPIARSLATLAAQSRYPAKSLAALRRHREAEGVAPDVLNTLFRLTHDELEVLRQAPAANAVPVPSISWLGVEAVADALGTFRNTILGSLRTTEGRRSLGWPWWDGHRWRIPEPAVNAATRATFMASLPDQEPSAHAAALPAWCERE